jgi:hypothetical protein
MTWNNTAINSQTTRSRRKCTKPFLRAARERTVAARTPGRATVAALPIGSERAVAGRLTPAPHRPTRDRSTASHPSSGAHTGAWDQQSTPPAGAMVGSAPGEGPRRDAIQADTSCHLLPATIRGPELSCSYRSVLIRVRLPTTDSRADRKAPAKSRHVVGWSIDSSQTANLVGTRSG